MDILTYGIFDVDVMVFYLEAGQTGQFALESSITSHTVYGNTAVTATTSGSITTFTYSQGAGHTVIKANGLLVFLLDQPSAWKFWAPSTTTNPDVKPNEQIFVLGPYLVRNASISGTSVYISGDNDNSTTIEVYTGVSAINTIVWNGIPSHCSQDSLRFGDSTDTWL
jgi:hypothetical protein